MKPFGLFLFLKNEGKIGEFPRNLRLEVVNRILELISELKAMTAKDGMLSKEHLKRELELYQKEYEYIKYTLKWQPNEEN